jgi:hypothetical protein
VQLVQLTARVYDDALGAAAGKVYHLAEAGALSEAVRPLKPDGSPDTDVMARLVVRHDDSAENVANRLALWDRQVSVYTAVLGMDGQTEHTTGLL